MSRWAIFSRYSTSGHAEREASPEVAVPEEVVVALLVVTLVATATLTAIILTPMVALLHHTPQLIITMK
jgi:hypothetical protein